MRVLLQDTATYIILVKAMVYLPSYVLFHDRSKIQCKLIVMKLTCTDTCEGITPGYSYLHHIGKGYGLFAKLCIIP